MLFILLLIGWCCSQPTPAPVEQSIVDVRFANPTSSNVACGTWLEIRFSVFDEDCQGFLQGGYYPVVHVDLYRQLADQKRARVAVIASGECDDGRIFWQVPSALPPSWNIANAVSDDYLLVIEYNDVILNNAASPLIFRFACPYGGKANFPRDPPSACNFCVCNDKAPFCESGFLCKAGSCRGAERAIPVCNDRPGCSCSGNTCIGGLTCDRTGSADVCVYDPNGAPPPPPFPSPKPNVPSPAVPVPMPMPPGSASLAPLATPVPPFATNAPTPPRPSTAPVTASGLPDYVIAIIVVVIVVTLCVAFAVLVVIIRASRRRRQSTEMHAPISVRNRAASTTAPVASQRVADVPPARPRTPPPDQPVYSAPTASSGSFASVTSSGSSAFIHIDADQNPYSLNTPYTTDPGQRPYAEGGIARAGGAFQCHLCPNAYPTEFDLQTHRQKRHL